MKKIYRYFKKVRKDLLYLLAVAIGGYFLIEILNIFPEAFPGANKFGQFFSKLCIAYTTSFIFYFVVVHIKTERDKENVSEYVAIRLSNIINSGHSYFDAFSKKSFDELTPQHLTRQVLDAVKRNDPNPHFTTTDGRPYTWLETYEYHKDKTFKSLNVIFARYNHLDSKLIKLLSRIEDSMMYYQWNMLYHFPYDESFGMFQMQLQTYMIAIKELEEYTRKNFKNSSLIWGEFLRATELSKIEEQEAYKAFKAGKKVF